MDQHILGVQNKNPRMRNYGFPNTEQSYLPPHQLIGHWYVWLSWVGTPVSRSLLPSNVSGCLNSGINLLTFYLNRKTQRAGTKYLVPRLYRGNNISDIDVWTVKNVTLLVESEKRLLHSVPWPDRSTETPGYFYADNFVVWVPVHYSHITSWTSWPPRTYWFLFNTSTSLLLFLNSWV